MTRRIATFSFAAALAVGCSVSFGQAGADREITTRDRVAAGAAGQMDQQASRVDMQLMQQYRQIAQEGGPTAADKLWVLETAVGNMCEIAIAQQAQQKSQSQDVKKLAQMLVEDHTQAGQQLKQIAQQMNLQLPEGLPSMKQQMIQAMAALDGRTFEQKFLAHNHAAHAKEVASFQAATQIAKDDRVKQFATQTLPKLQQHHQHVLQTAQAMGVVGTDVIRAGMLPQGNDRTTTPKDNR